MEPQKTRKFPPEWLGKYNDDDLERLAILTVDGGLTDEEAERELRLIKTKERLRDEQN